MKIIITLVISFFSLLSLKAQRTEIQYLSGTEPGNAVKWDFWCSAGMRSGRWEKIDVPSCWEQQGFGGYTYGRYYIYKERESEKPYDAYREHDFHDEYGIYRHRFTVPSSWKEKQVSIVFEGVMTDAAVKVNGMQAGPVHQGGFYRFAYDITDKLHFGRQNILEVTVQKQSADSSVNAAERRADWWLFGGIYRPVYLAAKPRTQIEHVAIDARADGTLNADLYLKNLPKGCRMELTLASLHDSESVSIQTCSLSVADKQGITTHWSNVRTWDPEHPFLYDLTLRLLSGERKLLHETTERIGFRTIEFRPQDGLYLNGTRLLVKGTNRHCFDPETGRTVSRARDLEDASLIKQMNMNAVRSHYPPDEHFLSLCDSMGLLYLDELCGWQQSYSTEVAGRLLPEMVFRDVNHPCIFLWSNGNEGGWNSAVDSLFARYDPQHRHVVHPWADFNGLDTRHYPTAQDYAYRLDRGHHVFLMTEFLHGLYDRGQGAGLHGLWEKFCTSPLFAGGFLWSYVDEALHRTDTGELDTYGPNAPDGIVGAYRQPEGSFYTVREVWSPVQIKPLRVTSSFQGEFRVENRALFSRLDEYRMRWRVFRLPPVGTSRLLSEGFVELPPLTSGETGTARFSLPDDFFQGDVLELESMDAAGRVVSTRTFPMKGNREYFSEHISLQHISAPSACYQMEEKYVVLKASDLSVRFNRSDGNLVEVRKGGHVIPLSGGPLPVGMKMLLTSQEVRMQGDTAVYVARYQGAVDSIVWRMAPDGLLGMDALMLNHQKGKPLDGGNFDASVHNLGFSFSFPEREISGMRWMGRGPYRVWKNRIRGTNYGIWEKAYNNTVTGEYHRPLLYPEFKGYHGHLYWVTFLSSSVSFTVYSESEGIYLRVFTPEEPLDRESRGLSMEPFPEGDLSFLLEIPAIESQGAGGGPSLLKVNRGDEGFRMKLWFQMAN